MAAVWKLPVVFVVENNRYGVSTNIAEACAVEDLSLRAQGYGIPGVRVDGFDVMAVYEAALEAVSHARRGDGPTLLVTESYRLDGHYAGEPEVYRSRSEVDGFWKLEPIRRFRTYLIGRGVASGEALDSIETEIKREIDEAVQYAKESREPDPSTAMDYIYA
jgi:TPP-dependent pyruvate/acetoin dehydrogenase alpha subunit